MPALKAAGTAGTVSGVPSGAFAGVYRDGVSGCSRAHSVPCQRHHRIHRETIADHRGLQAYLRERWGQLAQPAQRLRPPPAGIAILETDAGNGSPICSPPSAISSRRRSLKLAVTCTTSFTGPLPPSRSSSDGPAVGTCSRGASRDKPANRQDAADFRAGDQTPGSDAVTSRGTRRTFTPTAVPARWAILHSEDESGDRESPEGSAKTEGTSARLTRTDRRPRTANKLLEQSGELSRPAFEPRFTGNANSGDNRSCVLPGCTPERRYQDTFRAFRAPETSAISIPRGETRRWKSGRHGAGEDAPLPSANAGNGSTSFSAGGLEPFQMCRGDRDRHGTDRSGRIYWRCTKQRQPCVPNYPPSPHGL